jgi:hypothetical protein
LGSDPRLACDLPEAKTVIAEHDRAMNAPGAWKALCQSNSF